MNEASCWKYWARYEQNSFVAKAIMSCCCACVTQSFPSLVLAATRVCWFQFVYGCLCARCIEVVETRGPWTEMFRSEQLQWYWLCCWSASFRSSITDRRCNCWLIDKRGGGGAKGEGGERELCWYASVYPSLALSVFLRWGCMDSFKGELTEIS